MDVKTCGRYGDGLSRWSCQEGVSKQPPALRPSSLSRDSPQLVTEVVGGGEVPGPGLLPDGGALAPEEQCSCQNGAGRGFARPPSWYNSSTCSPVSSPFLPRY